jgi:hypothetical protein
MTDKDSLEDPLFDEIMAGFRQNAKDVTKDVLSGIGMFDFAAQLLLYMALLIAVYTVLLMWIGYYQLGNPIGLVGAGGTLTGAAVLAVFSFKFRKRHRVLKKKYVSLFRLFDKLGVS